MLYIQTKFNLEGRDKEGRREGNGKRKMVEGGMGWEKEGGWRIGRG